MAFLVAKANGDLTDSATWGLVDSTSQQYTSSIPTSQNLSTSYVETTGFTPGAITVDGVAFRLSLRAAGSPSNTLSIRLAQGGSTVAGTETTINVADLPANGSASIGPGWIFIKFASPVTLLAATAYTFSAKLSATTTNVGLYRNATTNNFDRLLRTTTAQAPAAGDTMIITGEKTGAGAQNTRTVTMNETATTDYGPGTADVDAMNIGPGGTLTYGTTAATNYYLKLSGNLHVGLTSNLNIGTTGTPIPRGSTAVLEFDPGADGAHGLIMYGNISIQGLSRTSAKNIIACKLNTDEAANQTSLGVDTDTGWLDNDEIVVASTSPTASQTEKGALNGNAGASSLTVDGFGGAGGGLANSHLGTSPQQAEVMLLTRNVMIRSATSTIMCYMQFNNLCVVDMDWADCRYMGEGTSTKSPWYIPQNNASGSINIQFCTLRDCEDGGVYITGGTNITISNNVFYNLNSANLSSNYCFYVPNAIGANVAVTDNYFATLGSGSGIYAIEILDPRFDFSGNTVISGIPSSVVGIHIGTNVFSSLSNFDDITIHSNNAIGMQIASAINFDFTIRNLKIWQCNSVGLNMAIAVTGRLILVDPLLLNNKTNDFSAPSGQEMGNIVFDGLVASSTQSVTGGLSLGNGITEIIDSDIGTHTSGASLPLNGANVQIFMRNTILRDTTEISFGNAGMGCFVKSKDHDQVAGQYRTFGPYGTIAEETTTRHTASGLAWKMTPTSATAKLIFPGPAHTDCFKVYVEENVEVDVTIYVRKDGSYNGNAPRLVVRGGILAGIPTETTDSLTVAANNWEQLVVTVTPTESGFLEYYVDCDGTAGNVFVDDSDIV